MSLSVLQTLEHMDKRCDEIALSSDQGVRLFWQSVEPTVTKLLRLLREAEPELHFTDPINQFSLQDSLQRAERLLQQKEHPLDTAYHTACSVKDLYDRLKGRKLI